MGDSVKVKHIFLLKILTKLVICVNIIMLYKQVTQPIEYRLFTLQFTFLFMFISTVLLFQYVRYEF